MLVFISDIHLTDGTTGPHNIDENDVEFFWNDIQVDGVKPKDIELVILGDFFDVIRSTQWKDIKPWDNNNTSVSQTAINIVQNTIKINKKPLDFMKDLSSKGVKIRYIIGNHDRLINAVPEARKLIRECLSIEKSPDPFPLEFWDKNLSIYATHGHEADVYNSFPWPDVTPIGDAIVTMLLNPFPGHPSLKGLSIKDSLKEIDNLRPATIAPLWIEHCIKSYGEDVGSKVKGAWKELVDNFYKDPFVKKWFDEYDSWLNPVDKADALQIAFEYFTESSMQGILEKILEIRNDFYKPKEEYLHKALDYMNEKGCDYIVFGHTHEPCIHLIEESKKGGKFYINSGTWRDRIVMGEPRKKIVPFAPLETISYVQFFNDTEMKETGRRFEVWDGSIGC
ncbi:MAG: metallophosphoesterase [Deltaproteobacteria bacterium]|nr:metallophosphoesterase [Deltaproteobacteria bacterium]